MLERRSIVFAREGMGRRAFGDSWSVGATRIREVRGDMDDGERAASSSECGVWPVHKS